MKNYLNLTSYYGQQVEMDNQARIMLPQILREEAKLDGGSGRDWQDDLPGSAERRDLEARSCGATE